MQIEQANTEENDRRSEKTVLEAEKFKAAMATPPGKTLIAVHKEILTRKFDNNFFHITCHIDPSLFGKIEGKVCSDALIVGRG